MPFRRRLLSRAGLLSLVVLGACQPDDSQFPPVCPQLSLLKDARDLTRFAGTTHDVTAMVLAAQITSIPARCSWGKPGTVTATLNVTAKVLRGPADKQDTASLDYFIALTEGSKVLREQDFTLPVQFPPNVEQVTAKGEDIELLLPVSKDKTAAAYQLYVGFRLTPDQLAYNRQSSQ
jgi:hypothetical protein